MIMRKRALCCKKLVGVELANQPLFHKRTKHIATRFHFVRERIAMEEANLELVCTLARKNEGPPHREALNGYDKWLGERVNHGHERRNDVLDIHLPM